MFAFKNNSAKGRNTLLYDNQRNTTILPIPQIMVPAPTTIPLAQQPLPKTVIKPSLPDPTPVTYEISPVETNTNSEIVQLDDKIQIQKKTEFNVTRYSISAHPTQLSQFGIMKQV